MTLTAISLGGEDPYLLIALAVSLTPLAPCAGCSLTTFVAGKRRSAGRVRHGLAEPEADGNLEKIAVALKPLAQVEPHLPQIVDLRFFCGYSFAEIAGVVDIPERTAQRDRNKARIRPRHHLRHQEIGPPGTTTTPPTGLSV